jgi:tetrahydromethanopterin S-methyltransferase subunit G
MPTPLPPSVQETLGDPAAGDFARWLETYVEERAVVRDEYREVLSRLDQIDERIDGVNERIDAMNKRIDRLYEQMRVQTRWTVGTIALFGTIVTVLLAIAEFSA